MSEIKQVIVYRKDLKMRKGKIAAQVAHASMKVFFDRGNIQDARLDLPGLKVDGIPVNPPRPCLMVWLTPEMKEWVEGLFTKIVLTVDSEEDLQQAHDLAKVEGLPVALIVDSGKTEFGGVPTATCIAIGPAKAEDIDKITGPEGRVPTRLP